MKPLLHAMTAAKRHGGVFMDYLAVHEFMDVSKTAVATNHHRAMLHHDMGVDIAVEAFGEGIVNADGTTVAVRDLAERHCLEDVGFVPKVEEWMDANERPPAFVSTRIRHRELAAISSDPATGLAERYGGDAAVYAPIVAHFERGARRSGSKTGLIAALTLNSLACVLAEKAFGPVLLVQGRKAPVSIREIGEMMALARFGVVPSPHQVVGGIRIADWMQGGCRAACMRGAPCPVERLAA